MAYPHSSKPRLSWALSACIALAYTALSLASGLKPNAGLEDASASVLDIHHWIVETGDHHALPFIVIDKVQAQVYVFNAQAQWVDSAPALLGAALGDVSAPDIGQRALRNIRPFEKTTAAGRFVAALGENLAGEQVLWIDYASALSLHPLRSVSAQEHRLERLTSPTPLDNRISFGCVNVMPAFFDKVVQPVFTHTTGTVYVLPETRSWPSVFLSPSVRFEPVH